MSKKIKHLDSLTIDKIAAGEVIDVPASCVKELIDNAIDAGATDILIEVQLGGRELIRVTDNGSGMTKEDVIACIERHSTSKLRTIDDFETLTSLGFRGEALAAIVAVSCVTIRSAQIDKSKELAPATILEAKGGEIVSVSDTQSIPGTMLEVRSLFYNIPARRKFLKTPSRDTQDIVKTVTNLALSSPHISFRLVADGKPMIAVAEEHEHSRITRAQALLGDPFQSEGIEVHKETKDLSIHGLIVSPSHMRSTRSGQHLIVNGRSVYSLSLSYAVRAGFGSTCEVGRHPFFVIHMTVDPASIDVNIHPQKKEIRFADEEWVKRMVRETVSEALFGKKLFTYRPDFSSFAPSEYSTEEPLELWKEEEKQDFSFIEEPTSPSCVCVIGDVALFKEQGDSLLLLNVKNTMQAILAKEMEQQEKTSSELLLVPIPIDCSVQEAAILSANLEKLKQFGFGIRSFGPQTFLVEEIPSRLFDLDVEQLLFDLLHEDSMLLQKQNARFIQKISTLYVASMKQLRSPISQQVATMVFERWSSCGKPKFAPSGEVCLSRFTTEQLQACMSKGNL